MAVTLYYSPGACSFVPHIALEETGEPYGLSRVDFGGTQQRSPEYLALNPKGRVPALTDGDFVLTENPAILRYIALKFPGANLWPDDPREDARCAEWLAWCSSGIHVAYAHVRRAERYVSSEAGKAEVIERGKASCREVWSLVEHKLAASRSDWAAGTRYSAADPNLLLFWAWGRGPSLGFDMATDFPAWTALARRVAERPAVRRAMEQEGVAPV